MTETELAERLGDATEQLRLARVELHEERRWRRWLLALFAVVFVFMGVVLLAPDWGLVSVANNNRDNGEILVECTTPGPRKPTADDPSTGHECYDRGQARTGEALGSIDINTRCAIQDALNQTLAKFDPDIGIVQIVNPRECFQE